VGAAGHRSSEDRLSPTGFSTLANSGKFELRAGDLSSMEVEPRVSLNCWNRFRFPFLMCPAHLKSWS